MEETEYNEFTDEFMEELCDEYPELRLFPTEFSSHVTYVEGLPHRYFNFQITVKEEGFFGTHYSFNTLLQDALMVIQSKELC